MKTPLPSPLLAVSVIAAVFSLMSGARAASLTSAGTMVNLTPEGFGTGTDVADLDGSLAGTDGFVLFNVLPEGDNLSGAFWDENIIDNKPAYITAIDGEGSTSSGGWANYDDVLIGGETYNTGGVVVGGAGDGIEVQSFTFTVGPGVPEAFRIGLIADNSDSANWDVSNVRIEGPGGASVDQDVIIDGGTDLVQFDISAAVAGEIYTVFGTAPPSGLLYGGITFDPATDITDPTDTDGDSLGDNWEVFYFGNITVSDGTGDAEPDGLTELEEWQLGTNPINADTDGDGLADGIEVDGGNPDNAVTDPLVADTDGDGLSDGDEVLGNNPGDFTSNPTLTDTDSDQWSDADEVSASTDPRNPQDFPMPAAADLLAYYEFEDDFLDSSGGGNTAAPSQNPTEVNFIPAFRGMGADINDPDEVANSGGAINIPIDANPNSLPEVSFGGWVNVEEFEFDGFMAIDNGGWDRGITVNAQESATFGIASGAAPVGIGNISPGDWQYVVGTFSLPEGRATLYVGDDNESNQTTESEFTADDGVPPGELEIEIGRYDNQDLDAVVDDIFVFGRELTAHQANAIRNLRLSALDYTPVDAAQLFSLFEDDATGNVNGVSWSPTSGLATTNPGELFDLGGKFALLLDDLGNGMQSGPATVFAITRIERTPDKVELDFTSRNGRIYAVDVSINLQQWLEADDSVVAAGDLTTFTDTDASRLEQPTLYYRVRSE